MLSRIRRNSDLSECQQDIASILDLAERGALPYGSVEQLVLLGLRSAGYHLYAYEGAARGRFYLWFDRLAELRDDKNGRVPVEEWQANYSAILRELLTEGGNANG